MLHILWIMTAVAIANVIAVKVSWLSLVALGVAERFAPCNGQRPRLASQVRGIVFQVLSIGLGTAMATPLVLMVGRHAPLWPALAFPLAFLISDFLQYWEHRLEHLFLWRFHAVHHSPEDMCAAANFHHFSHHVFMAFIYGLPLGLLTNDPMAAPMLVIPLTVWGHIIHSPLKLSLGPLRWVWIDNRFHRIHHSVEERHWNRNFGAFLPLWDWVFGTLHMPQSGEWPETGVPGYGEVETVRGALLRPFMS